MTYLLPDETAHFGDAGTGLFMWVAAQCAEAAHAVEQGADERAVREELDIVLDHVVARLTGR
ncbi:hypothetical protein GCM10027093_08930 [Paraburkholderia jirisanensis]